MVDSLQNEILQRYQDLQARRKLEMVVFDAEWLRDFVKRHTNALANNALESVG